ncbi:MAG TPA: protoporphyrinogen oxidase [Terriglobales bacterium]|nr:protoporphyrinogen oxidase [Terriglobales bacterium]
MKRIAIVGGGISGLAAAHALGKHRNKGAELECVVFEASSRFGGVIQTEQIDGFVIEAGPDSFLTEKTWASDFCRELGLGDQLIVSNESERRTYVLVNGNLVPLPDGMMFMVPSDLPAAFFSRLFSWQTKLRILREWFYRASADAPETTVAEFVERHFGREMVERVADPLLAGVYGGNAEELSVTAVLPRFAEIEAKQGSLARAMVAARKLQTAPLRPLFTSLKNGMRTMIDALVAQIPQAARRLNTFVEAIEPESGKWLARSGGRTEEFDAVILAMPAYASANFLRADFPQLASELAEIRYSSSVILAAAYDQRARTPAGFGFLVPRSEGKRILACTFVHQKFQNRAPQDRALVRCFLGGSRDEEILGLSDQQIERIAYRELHEVLGITAKPLFVRTYRWPKAMAQYGLGHKARVERIRQLTSSIRGLALTGNAYSGIGIPDCVRLGSETAAKVLSDLALSPAAQ